MGNKTKNAGRQNTALRKMVVKAAADGLTMSQIAAKAGVSRQRVGQLCARMNIKLMRACDHYERTADEVERMARAGASNHEIAGALSIPQEKVRVMRAKRGVSEPNPIVERRKEVLRLAQSGMSPMDIAQALGVSYHAIQGDREALGLRNAQPSLEGAAKRRKRIQALFRQGKTVAHIARTLGVHYGTVHNETLVFRLDPQVRAAVEARLLMGKRTGAIREETGCNGTQIRAVANELRIRGLIKPGVGRRMLTRAPKRHMRATL